MKKFIKDLLSTSNEINENTIVGLIFIVVFLAMLVVDVVAHEFDSQKYYIVAGLIAASFGFGALKK